MRLRNGQELHDATLGVVTAEVRVGKVAHSILSVRIEIVEVRDLRSVFVQNVNDLRVELALRDLIRRNHRVGDQSLIVGRLRLHRRHPVETTVLLALQQVVRIVPVLRCDVGCLEAEVLVDALPVARRPVERFALVIDHALRIDRTREVTGLDVGTQFDDGFP